MPSDRAAFGNSDGDLQMLEWTQAGRGVRLMMLVHHDDAKREWAYGAESKIGTFSDSLTTEATKKGWTDVGRSCTGPCACRTRIQEKMNAGSLADH